MAETVKISVIVCTYNRCETLTRTLESITASRLSDQIEWEVLVIDNNSKDRTREVVEDFCRRYPERFRYVHEARQGLSNARNTGIREARGEILAFTDDDIVVDGEWLQNLTRPLLTGGYAGAGGCIVAAHEFVCPDWLALEGEYNLGGVLALHNPGDQAGESKLAPVGANMAYRAQIFQKYGGFRTDLGRSANSLIGNEDMELGSRLLRGGERLWFEPSAVVYHQIAECRLSKSYFLAFWFSYGRAMMRELSNRNDVWIIPRWCFSVPRIIINVLPSRLRLWLFSRDPKRRFFFKCSVWRTWGEIVELPRLWLETKRQGGKKKATKTTLQSPDITFGE